MMFAIFETHKYTYTYMGPIIEIYVKEYGLTITIHFN